MSLLAFTLPMALAAVFLGVFLLNEWSEGGLAEALGLGPHHALASGGACATPETCGMGWMSRDHGKAPLLPGGGP